MLVACVCVCVCARAEQAFYLQKDGVEAGEGELKPDLLQKGAKKEKGRRIDNNHFCCANSRKLQWVRVRKD